MSEAVQQFVELAKVVGQEVDRRFVYWCPKCKKNTWHVLRALGGRRFEMCGVCGVYGEPRNLPNPPAPFPKREGGVSKKFVEEL